MFDRRTKNVTIFKDSMEMMSENERLQQAIKESVEKQTLYLEAENVEIPESNASKCRTLVSTGRSFETASRPIVGSSRKRIFGLCKSDAAISHRIR